MKNRKQIKWRERNTQMIALYLSQEAMKRLAAGEPYPVEVPEVNFASSVPPESYSTLAAGDVVVFDLPGTRGVHIVVVPPGPATVEFQRTIAPFGFPPA